MGKKVLLTGVSGYIGNHCAAELLKNGYSVRGSLRDMSKSDSVLEAIKKRSCSRWKLRVLQIRSS
jgi:dihydroflavonol-4-reductase